ncbi:MAG TPA: hypothetical protein VFZ61_26125, partial [Polyangiales bacterium]
GSHARSSGDLPADASLLTSWASGDNGFTLPEDVGLHVVHGPEARIGLEVSYSAGPGVLTRTDRSGVRLCLKQRLRAKEAAFHWLGTQQLGNLLPAADQLTEAGGACTTGHASHLIGYVPRMRHQGRHLKATLTRTDGSSVALFDRPFEEHRQNFVWLPGELAVDVGDRIETVCTHARDKIFWFGAGSRDEVCYALVLAWPAGSLTHAAPSPLSGLNTCY